MRKSASFFAGLWDFAVPRLLLLDLPRDSSPVYSVWSLDDLMVLAGVGWPPLLEVPHAMPVGLI